MSKPVCRLGDYDREAIYAHYKHPPWEPDNDVSAALMASVDPKSTPYIIMLDKGWLPRIRGGQEIRSYRPG